MKNFWNYRHLLLLTMLCGLLAQAGWAQQADEVAPVGRALAEKWQQSVVTIAFVVKTHAAIAGQNQDEENKSEALGVMIAPSGLTVTALSALQAGGNEQDAAGGENGEKIAFTSEITSAKFLLPNGKELPAQVVLRDRDLDLAFLRPLKTPAQPLPMLNLTQASEPLVLDTVISLARLGTVANRSLALYRHLVTAVLEKPRKYFMIAGSEYQTGSPAFTKDGKLIGIIVERKNPVTANSSLTALSLWEDIPVILPAATIAEVAEQAAQVKVPASTNKR